MQKVKLKDCFPISTIGNYYGGLLVSFDGERYLWGIEGYNDDIEAEEIPYNLFRELVKFDLSQATNWQDEDQIEDWLTDEYEGGETHEDLLRAGELELLVRLAHDIKWDEGMV